MIHRYGKQPFRVAVVHGGPGACGSLACVAKELSKTHGAVEPIQSKFNISELIDELHAQLNEITATPIILLGHSWGAWLVVLYAAKDPQLIEQIVLVGSAPFKKEYVPRIMERRLNNLSDTEAKTLLALVSQLKDTSSATDKDALLAALGALAGKADTYDPLDNDMTESAPDAAMYSALWPQAEELRSTGALALTLGKLQCPCIVIHGEHDPPSHRGRCRAFARIWDSSRHSCSIKLRSFALQRKTSKRTVLQHSFRDSLV